MGLITTALGSVVGIFLSNKPYWAIRLTNGKWLSELDTVKDDRRPEGKRPFSWDDDLVDNGDVSKIKQLWLFCPPNPMYPLGQSDFLTVPEKGVCFQLKVAMVDGFSGMGRSMQSQLIGVVTDKVSGACECRVWDSQLNVMGKWYSNVYNMGTWRDGIAPIQAISHRVMGLNLT